MGPGNMMLPGSNLCFCVSFAGFAWSCHKASATWRAAEQRPADAWTRSMNYEQSDSFFGPHKPTS